MVFDFSSFADALASAKLSDFSLNAFRTESGLEFECCSNGAVVVVVFASAASLLAVGFTSERL